MIRRRVAVLLYGVLIFPTIDGTSNTHFVRRGSIRNEPERLVIRGLTEGIGDDQSQDINIQRQLRPKGDKQSEEHKLRTDRHDNILYQWEGDELFTTKNTKNTKKDRKVMPPHKSSATTHKRVRNNISKYTTKPFKRSAPGYEPIPTPTLTPSYHDDNRDGSLSRATEDPKIVNEDDTQGRSEIPTCRPTNFISRPDLDQKSETVLSTKPPTSAPVRLPTRVRNYASPPTRTGLSIDNGDLCDGINIAPFRQPSREQHNSSPLTRTRLPYTFDPVDLGDGNDDQGTDDNDQDENVNEEDVPISFDDEENDDKDGPPIVPDDKESEDIIDQETIEDEGIIEDPTPIDNNGGDDLGSFDSEDDASTRTWMHVLIGLGTSCLFCVALAIFLRHRSQKFNAYHSAGGKDGDVVLEAIDNIIPVDQTGGYSGYARMNSTKSYADFEDIPSDAPDPSHDFAFERHDPCTITPSDQSFGSKSMYESEGEEQMSNIDDDEDDYADEYIDEDEGIDDDIDDDDNEDFFLYKYDDENDDSSTAEANDPYIEDEPSTAEVDDPYTVNEPSTVEVDDPYTGDDPSTEEDDDPSIEDDPNTEENDDASMEESTISSEEEECLSTIDEESNQLGDW